MWQIVIPMAGEGRRMAPLTQGLPKMLYRLRDGTTVLEKALAGIRSAFRPARWHFVAQRAHLSEWPIELHCERLLGGQPVSFHVAERRTRGPLDSARLALEMLDCDAPVVLHNCDTYVRFRDSMDPPATDDVLVPVFRSTSPAYSYCRTDGRMLVHEIAEKRVLAQGLASSGTYIFKSVRALLDASQAVLDTPAPQAEFFVSDVVAQMLATRSRVRALLLAECAPLGTPEEIMTFERSGDSALLDADIVANSRGS
jgi:NDP-sugar pyrophosphorylase family protein